MLKQHSVAKSERGLSMPAPNQVLSGKAEAAQQGSERLLNLGSPLPMEAIRNKERKFQHVQLIPGR